MSGVLLGCLASRVQANQHVCPNGSPFLDQDRIAHWDMCLEFETGRKVYTHRFLICAAFQFFEGLFETELDEWYFYKMPPPEEQPVTADMMCLMLSFLYEDWQVSGLTNDRLSAKCRHVKNAELTCLVSVLSH